MGGRRRQIPALDEIDEGVGDGVGIPRAPATGVIPAIDPVGHAEQREHEQPRLGGPNLARPRRALDDPAHRAVVAGFAAHDVALQPRWETALLAEEHGEEGALGDDEPDVMADHLAQLLRRRQPARPDRCEARLRERHGPVEDRREQVFLRVEVAVHGRLRDAEAARQVVQCRGAISPRAEQLRGGGEDLRPHERPARRPRAHASQWWQAMQSSGACIPRLAFSWRWHSTHQPIVNGRWGGLNPTRRVRSSVSAGPVSPPTTGMRWIGPWQVWQATSARTWGLCGNWVNSGTL